MGNPEPGIYTGSLNEDIVLVYFKNKGTYGVHWADVSYEGWDTTRMVRSKQPLETGIDGLRPNEWTKYSHETEKVIDIAAKHGYTINFEANIRPAIIEIMDSIRVVHQEMVDNNLAPDDLIDMVTRWCDYCPINGHELCQFQDVCPDKLEELT